MTLNPRREVGERREKLRHDDFRAFDVGDFDHLRGSGGIEHIDANEQPLAVRGRSNVEVVHHHHASERDFLRDLTARAMFGETLQDAVLRGKFSACHSPGRTGTLTASPPRDLRSALHGQFI